MPSSPNTAYPTSTSTRVTLPDTSASRRNDTFIARPVLLECSNTLHRLTHNAAVQRPYTAA